MIVFDIETDGLLDSVSKIHTIHMYGLHSAEATRFTDHKTYSDGSPVDADGGIVDAIEVLEEASCVGGHNIIAYDIPVIEKLIGRPLQLRTVRDSLVMSRVMFPDLKDRDFQGIRAKAYPEALTKLVGSHSLEAWGVRLGEAKADFSPSDYGFTWATVPFLREMDEYCAQDVRLNSRLFSKLESYNYSDECLELEHEVATIIARQVRTGWQFDMQGAERLVAKLQIRKLELEEELREVFGAWYKPTGRFVPKRSNAKLGYVEGVPTTKVKRVEFNPGSRDHIASRLQALGWTPREFTPGGKPKVDETTLESLTFPEAKLCAEYLMISKRLGQVAEGREAWIKKVQSDGRIRGRVNSNGAVTGRMTHKHPNVAQVPRSTSPYGHECRELWIAKPGYKLVGCDAEGLELRVLAHYMARYDGGEYAKAVVEGRKEEGTDAHTVNQRAIGLNSRDSAKTWFYAFIYGAGPLKLGSIVVDDYTEDERAEFLQRYPAGATRDSALSRIGKQSNNRMLSRVPALSRLTSKIKEVGKKRRWLRGLDGRRIPVRSLHSACNTLFQSGGAVIMKKALVIHNYKIRSLELDAEYVGNIHDEFQLEALEEHADLVGELAADSIRIAGEYYNLSCPLSGDYSVGDSWAETH